MANQNLVEKVERARIDDSYRTRVTQIERDEDYSYCTDQD